MEVVGTAKTGTKGTTETGTVGIAETGAMGVAGVVAEGMSTSVMTPGPSKISTKYGDIKGNCSKGETQIHAPNEEMTKKGGGMDLAKNKKKGERYIPMNSVSGGASFLSSESEILFFKTGSLSGSSRMSLDPSKDKSTSGPHVVELGMEEGATTSEEPSFTA